MNKWPVDNVIFLMIKVSSELVNYTTPHNRCKSLFQPPASRLVPVCVLLFVCHFGSAIIFSFCSSLAEANDRSRESKGGGEKMTDLTEEV